MYGYRVSNAWYPKQAIMNTLSSKMTLYHFLEFSILRNFLFSIKVEYFKIIRYNQINCILIFVTSFVLFCFGERRRKNMLSYFHKKVYSRTIFLMSKFFVIWDLQLLPGPFNSLFRYEICSKSQKLSLSFFLPRLILHVFVR